MRSEQEGTEMFSSDTEDSKTTNLEAELSLDKIIAQAKSVEKKYNSKIKSLERQLSTERISIGRQALESQGIKVFSTKEIDEARREFLVKDLTLKCLRGLERMAEEVIVDYTNDPVEIILKGDGWDEFFKDIKKYPDAILARAKELMSSDGPKGAKLSKYLGPDPGHFYPRREDAYTLSVNLSQ